MEKLRIRYDEIDNDKVHEVEIYRGQLFTGLLYENYRSGELWTETEYMHGYPHGWSREWYKNGQLKEEEHFVWTVFDGLARQWHENGQIKLEKQVEQGIAVWSKEWDEKGNLIREFEIDKAHSLYSWLQVKLENRQNWLDGVNAWEKNPPRVEDFPED